MKKIKVFGGIVAVVAMFALSIYASSSQNPVQNLGSEKGGMTADSIGYIIL